MNNPQQPNENTPDPIEMLYIESPAISLSEFRRRVQDEILKAQTNAVAWTVGEIDKIHFAATGDDDDNDPIFKGIKNTLRIRYEVKTGIDPAPNYPVKAQLNQPNTNKETTCDCIYNDGACDKHSDDSSQTNGDLVKGVK